MTASSLDSVPVEATTPKRATSLRTLAVVEARRYARHPLFLTGVALLAWFKVLDADNLGEPEADVGLLPAFLLGVLGLFVANRLATSMDGSADAVEASPTDEVTKTAALCLACLVPGAVALAWLTWTYMALAIWPAPDSGISSGDRAAWLLAGVVSAVGGPLVGVLVGRWVHFPGAALVAAVFLIGWTVLGTIGLAMSASRVGTLVHVNPPFTIWIFGDSNHPDAVVGGSPWWYLGYITALCGLAATAAVLHEAHGTQRPQLIRALAVLAVLALGCLALTALADPTRTPL
jgi:hypothetical protein